MCEVCLKVIQVTFTPALKFPEKIELEDSDDEDARCTRDGFQAVSFKEAPAAYCSRETPAATPTLPKDSDKALTNVALGIFKINNWPCQEERGYRSFVARVKFRSPQLGVTTTDNFNVSAEQGLLILQSPVLDLPDKVSATVLDTLNEINQRSVSSVFIQNGQGIVMRHALIPLQPQEGYLNGAMLLQTLRQMNHDRRHALSLLRQAVENGKLDPLGIARAFAQPMAPSRVQNQTIDQLVDVAALAGFVAFNNGGQLTLSREQISPDKCRVRISVCPGFIRGSIMLGERNGGNYTWRFVPPRIRALLPIDKSNESGRLAQLYEQCNQLNEHANLVRIVSTQKHVVATSTFFPVDQPISIDQFKVYGEALLQFAESDNRIGHSPVNKMAG